MNCANSIAPRPQVNLGFRIWDCGLKNKSAIPNLKSEIKLAESRGLEPLCDFSRQFSGLLPHRFGLPSALKKKVRWCGSEFEEITFFFRQQQQGNLAGTFRFELKTSILETEILPIKLRTYFDLWFVIADFGFSLKSAITNHKSEIGVSDGNRTRNIRFGRPTIASRPLSFAHILIRDSGSHQICNHKSQIRNRNASGKSRTFIAKSQLFYRQLNLANGDRCTNRQNHLR